MTQAACLLAFLCFVLLLSYIHSITVTKELIRIILHTQGRKEGRKEGVKHGNQRGCGAERNQRTIGGGTQQPAPAGT